MYDLPYFQLFQYNDTFFRLHVLGSGSVQNATAVLKAYYLSTPYIGIRINFAATLLSNTTTPWRVWKQLPLKLSKLCDSKSRRMCGRLSGHCASLQATTCGVTNCEVPQRQSGPKEIGHGNNKCLAYSGRVAIYSRSPIFTRSHSTHLPK